MSFGTRLAEERKRLGLKQAEFAALVGTDVPKQSLYENDRRELRADYLARLAANKVDVVYVLTARRMEGEWLPEDATDLLSTYLALPPDLQKALLTLAGQMKAHVGQASPRTVHEPPIAYRSEGAR
ncbi:MAG: helix-turn-helix domain-containing protein [Alphaproteobacteria bacterium]|nr:helix-turn-helix domain-containing protein [Alphaproteobacteria bacterium]MBV9371261.1 helix-turn-helix domain-containing protein [Alphaproteobacteria bacterium]MBV9902800.1 helix-turn-helix domain-containing protein [Alphaproteobacteria bacterium]